MNEVKELEPPPPSPSCEVTQEALEPTSTSRALRNQLKEDAPKRRWNITCSHLILCWCQNPELRHLVRGLLIFGIASEVARHATLVHSPVQRKVSDISVPIKKIPFVYLYPMPLTPLWISEESQLSFRVDKISFNFNSSSSSFSLINIKNCGSSKTDDGTKFFKNEMDEMKRNAAFLCEIKKQNKMYFEIKNVFFPFLSRFFLTSVSKNYFFTMM